MVESDISKIVDGLDSNGLLSLLPKPKNQRISTVVSIPKNTVHRMNDDIDIYVSMGSQVSADLWLNIIKGRYILMWSEGLEKDIVAERERKLGGYNGK